FFFFQAEDGIRDSSVTGVQTCALPISGDLLALDRAVHAPSTDYTVGKTGPVNGAIKCQQIAGGDGYSVMGDGTQTYLFSFGPLSGIADITQGRPGTEFPSVFNSPFPVSKSNYMVPGDPATSVDTATTVSGGLVQPLTGAQLSSIASFYNGAVGLDYDVAHTFSIAD